MQLPVIFSEAFNEEGYNEQSKRAGDKGVKVSV